MPDSLLFSVIIPTCHRNDTLALCLDRLAPGAQTLSPDRYEVIVTDDGRNTTAEELVRQRYPWAQWTQGPRRGPAANRNHGASLARGEWFVFTDDDCLPENGWLEAYASAVTGEAQVYEGLTYAIGSVARLDEGAPTSERGGNLWSCNMCVAASAYSALAGFDERFPYPGCEDVDFRYKVLGAGLEYPFVPDARVGHPVQRRGGRGAATRHVRSVLILADKYRRGPHRSQPLMMIRHSLVRHAKGWVLSGPRYRWRGIGRDILWMSVELLAACRVALLYALPARR